MEEVIGVTMEASDSICHSGLSYRQVAKTVAEKMMRSRSRVNPVWRPYIKQSGLDYKESACDLYFRLKEYYPEAEPGDVVYVACDVVADKDYEVWLNFVGVVEVFLDGEHLFSSWEQAVNSEKNLNSDDMGQYYTYLNFPVKMKGGQQYRLVVKNVCTEESAGFRLNISPPRCPGLWANFYLVLARVMLPIEGLQKEEGVAVSCLYQSGKSPQEAYQMSFPFESEPAYAFPRPKAEADFFDFEHIYATGNLAVAYAEAENNAEIEIFARSALKILVDGVLQARLLAGESQKIFLKKGSILLIKSKREASGWGFWVREKTGLGFSWLDTDRKDNFIFALCGPFYQESLEMTLPVEACGKNLLHPFPNGRGEMVFWRFQNAYLRAYCDSSFFGQWYYASMLSILGILKCADVMEQSRYEAYFMDCISFLADWYDYALYDRRTFDRASFMELASVEDELDNIGTMGTCFIEAYQRSGEWKYQYQIERLQRNLKSRVSRFEDGTFCRKRYGTMWADDFYMSGTFLSALYGQMHDEESLQDFLCQCKGVWKRLYMPEENIFSHIFFLEKEEKNKIPWGRGNGWVALAMSEMLMYVPKQSETYQQLQPLFNDFCEGIEALQDESGLWHQVLNRPESYLETSCTAMFSLAMMRGVRYGWLPERYLQCAQRGLDALLARCVDKNGLVYGVCMGSSCSMDEKYYLNLQTIKDDNHGTGIVLMLLCEKLIHESKGTLQNSKITLKDNANHNEGVDI